MRAIPLTVGCMMAALTSADGQGDTNVARVRGVAFDSLRGRPLADAFIAVAGGGQSTVSDSMGRFQFDKFPRGSHSVILQHATLDSLGFPGLSTRVTITDGVAEVRIGVPSFATLWRKACGEGIAPADSGFVYGTVLNATTNQPIANADISLVWHDSITLHDPRGTDLAAKTEDALLNSRRRPAPKNQVIAPMEQPRAPFADRAKTGVRVGVDRWRLQARSDQTGTYAVCGVPVRAHGILVTASTDSDASDSIGVHMDLRVLRRDLRIAPTLTSGAARWGTVTGKLTDQDGLPFPFARVLIAGAPEGRSDETGSFTIREVAAGTRRVDILFIGMTPAHLTVDVVAGDTATVALTLSRARTLAGMSVKAIPLGRVMAAEFDARRKLGLGFVADSSELSRYPSVTSALRAVPSLTIAQRGASLSASISDGQGGTCTPIVWLDGVEASYGNLSDLLPSEVAGLEVYTRPLTVPTTFRTRGIERKCGAIIVWTRYLFKNR